MPRFAPALASSAGPLQRRAFFALAALAVCAGLSVARAPAALADSPLQPAITKVCGVMAGTIKPDGQALQLIMMMGDSMGDANPVSLGLQRGVITQCPKAYLAYQQRARASNPYSSSALLPGKPVTLLGKTTTLLGKPTTLLGTPTTLVQSATPQDYAMRCRAGNNMASASGSTLVLTFLRPEHPAEDGLAPGQCGWITRNLRAGEPSRIELSLGTALHAKRGASKMNAHGLWTFWVYNATTTFKATAVAKGTPTAKPH